MKDSVNVREAQLADSGLVLEFIKRLAAYEEREDQVAADEAAIRKSIFEEKYAYGLLAELDGQTVGFAVYFFNYSTFLGRPGLYLEDVFVMPEHRGQGVGKAILRRLAQIAAEKDCGRMEWSCLKWNRSAIDFYLSLGAKDKNEWTVYSLNREKIEVLAQS